ncbi:GntR family transcriptional regulator [Micromonospora halophytica]|uniref:Transcriptional regulator, GntR family n=1 Tax=Micromonospora halophytica TaxID=47864 RepID=A0A1C5H9L1_9ACTN|nr:GntR family transcriptional regulator [Micromonospora halophytica]SCG42699.1 transcriptional regulator, GntR family [Micromonospora halophytica]
MIEFVLNGRSRVNTYVQLIEQVKQALRVGLLMPGDQLPKVRDVAQSLAINPNTVLKAYRELEIEGLVEGRPGVGTFVRRTLAGASLGNQLELREELVAWVQRARAAGLAPEDVTALVETTMRAALAAEASRDQTARTE